MNQLTAGSKRKPTNNHKYVTRYLVGVVQKEASRLLQNATAAVLPTTSRMKEIDIGFAKLPLEGAWLPLQWFILLLVYG